MNLLIGPYLGEMGYELFHFQGRVRTYLTQNRDKYNKIVVGCRKGNEYLYELATDFYHPAVYPLQTQGISCKGVSPYYPLNFITKYNKCKVIGSKEIIELAEKNTFIKFGIAGSVDGYDILFHARNSFKYSTASRNWIPEYWPLLAGQFNNLKTASIGTVTESLHVEGTTDLRGMPLKELVNIIASSRVVVGPVSGAIHLATLCGTPQVVWTNTAKWNVGTNKDRCIRHWNPFGTVVKVIDKYGWKPSVETVFEAVKEILL